MNKKKKKKVSEFDRCFDRHATDEVKLSVEAAGDYHKFILEKAFKQQKDQVMKQSIREAAKGLT